MLQIRSPKGINTYDSYRDAVYRWRSICRLINGHNFGKGYSINSEIVDEFNVVRLSVRYNDGVITFRRGRNGAIIYTNSVQ